jgi:hypothetical protein
MKKHNQQTKTPKNNFDFDDDFIRSLRDNTQSYLDGRPIRLAKGVYKYTKQHDSSSSSSRDSHSTTTTDDSEHSTSDILDPYETKRLRVRINALKKDSANLKQYASDSYAGNKSAYVNSNTKSIPILSSIYVDAYAEKNYKAMEYHNDEIDDLTKALNDIAIPIATHENVKNNKAKQKNSKVTFSSDSLDSTFQKPGTDVESEEKDIIEVSDEMYTQRPLTDPIPPGAWENENICLSETLASYMHALPRIREITSTLRAIRIAASSAQTNNNDILICGGGATASLSTHMEELQARGLKYNHHSWHETNNELHKVYLQVATGFYDYTQCITQFKTNVVDRADLDSFVQNNIKTRVLFIATKENEKVIKQNIRSGKFMRTSEKTVTNQQYRNFSNKKRNGEKNLAAIRTGRELMAEFFEMKFTLVTFFYTLY